MSCILRVGGKELKIGALLRQLPFAPYRTWCKGDVHEIRKKVLTDSGAAFNVSEQTLTNLTCKLKTQRCSLKSTVQL